MNRSRLVFLSFGLLLLAGFASGAKGEWIKVESKNFVLVGDATESDMRDVAARLEQFRLSLTTLFPDLKVSTPVPTRVYVFRDDVSFTPFKPSYGGKTQGNVGGYFVGWPTQNYIALSTDKNWRDPMRPVFHEYEHFVLHNNLGQLPAWLDEGLAEFYSTFYTSKDGKKATIGDPISAHTNTFRKDGIWPLARLFAVDHGSADYHESYRAGTFYGESWALVHYLMFQDLKNGTTQFTQFIRDQLSGVPVEQAFIKAFQRDYRTIESELRRYVSNETFPVIDVEFREQIQQPKDLVATKLPESEMQFFAGDLEYHISRFKDAEGYLNKAIALNPHSVDTLNLLGALHRTQDRSDLAKQDYAAAIAADPKNYAGYLSMAIIAGEDPAASDALGYFRKALELAPNESKIHYQLGVYYARHGQDEQAATEYSTAMRLDPKNYSIDRELSFSLLRLGRGQYAARAAQEYLRSKGWDDAFTGYLVLAACVGLRQSGQAEQANALATTAGARVPNGEWPAPVFRYFRQELSATELIAQAINDDELSEAHAYIGFWLSFTGNANAAREHFDWVATKARKLSPEWVLVRDELRRLAAIRASKLSTP
jgi:Flp pilus assembly protein TadD